MRKLGKKLLLCLLGLLMITPHTVQAEEDNFDQAVWVSYLDFQKYLKDKNEEEFTEAFEEIAQTAVDYKLDTLIVHVRAFQDAVYPSSMFPTADWISSDQAPLDYDALEIMIDIAHDHGLKFEAWVNPYRISLDTEQSNRWRASSYAKRFEEGDTISYMSGSVNRVILNPVSQRARDYIVDGIAEIVRNYDVDGIHFDDYFYQTGTMGNTTVEQRKANVNLLLKDVYDTIKRIDDSVTFGVSPMGNLDNARDQGADLETWLSQEGYVDYLMPQIYWTDQWSSSGNVTMYTDRLNAFNAIWTNHNIELKVGLGLYMIDRKPTGDIGWQLKDTNLKEQVELAKQYGLSGFALFRYEDLLKPSTQNELNNLMSILDGPSQPQNPETPETPENPNPPTETIKDWWIEENGIWVFYQDNQPVSNIWVADYKNDWFYAGANGVMLENSWIARDANLDVWYYVGEGGAMLYDTTTPDGYYVDASGAYYQ